MTRAEESIVRMISSCVPAVASATAVRCALHLAPSEFDAAVRELISIGWISRGHMFGAVVLVLVEAP